MSWYPTARARGLATAALLALAAAVLTGHAALVLLAAPTDTRSWTSTSRCRVHAASRGRT